MELLDSVLREENQTGSTSLRDETSYRRKTIKLASFHQLDIFHSSGIFFTNKVKLSWTKAMELLDQTML